MKNKGENVFFFDEFAVDQAGRILLKNGKTIALNPKTLDLLLALVERHGEIVSKNDLLDAVWENQFVEEKNLTVHVAALRKIFGERKDENRFIATIPGTGYKFVAPLIDSAIEIVIETEAIERITVEEIEEEIDDNKNQRAKSKFSSTRTFAFYILPFIFSLLLGGYVWQKSVQKNSATSSVKRLTTNGKVQLAALSPDGKLFAYVINDLEKSSLWLGYTGGGNDIRLRPPSESAFEQLVFSPDNNQLYFTMREEPDPNFALYRMAAFGGGQEKIVDNISDFGLSPDGTQIAFGRGNDTEHKDSIVVLSLKDKNERKVFSNEQSRSFGFQSIAWSPDGKRLAFDCKREDQSLIDELCFADVSGGEIERLNLHRRYIHSIVWLKSGTSLIVTAIPENSWSSVEHFDILQVELPDRNVREITNDLSTYNSMVNVSDDETSILTIEHRQLDNLWVAPSDNLSQSEQITFGSFGKYDGLWGLDWTPDGRIVFTNSDTESQVISIMNADGSEPKELTLPGFVDSALTVSNDGRYIVFHSNRGGHFDIWRMDADGRNLKQLTFSNLSFQPSISPDNQYVYYKCWLNNVGDLRRVPIDGGESEILTDKETGWSSFSPDGRYFAATYRTDKRRMAVFSAETNEIIKQFELPKTSVFDMRPRWTPDSRSIVYRDNTYGYWSQSIEGGDLQKIVGLPKEVLFTYAFSKDGKKIAFVRGQQIRDVILITGKK